LASEELECGCGCIMFIMALFVERIVKVDKQGRMVLPKDVRRALGMEGETAIVVGLLGNRIILEKFSWKQFTKFCRIGGDCSKLRI